MGRWRLYRCTINDQVHNQRTVSPQPTSCVVMYDKGDLVLIITNTKEWLD
jgi:hypothetical protein